MPTVYSPYINTLFSSYIFAEEGEEKNSNAYVAGKDSEKEDVEKEEELPSKTCNTILADRHRVSICGWPIRGARDKNDPRVKNIKSLFEHVWQSGYDGIEISVEDMLVMYPKEAKKMSSLEFAQMLKEEADEHGIQIFGSVPPYFRSYNYGDINQKFCDFYNKLVRILMNKVDVYLIETAIEFI